MALKEIAVEGMTLVFDPPTVSGSISIMGLASLKTKIDGSGVYTDGLTISISSIISTPSAPTPDPMPHVASINSTATYVKEGGSLVLRVGDKTDTITANPINPSGSPVPTNFKIVIQSAGQTKVKAE